MTIKVNQKFSSFDELLGNNTSCAIFNTSKDRNVVDLALALPCTDGRHVVVMISDIDKETCQVDTISIYEDELPIEKYGWNLFAGFMGQTRHIVDVIYEDHDVNDNLSASMITSVTLE